MEFIISILILALAAVILLWVTKYAKNGLKRLIGARLQHFYFISSVTQISIVAIALYVLAIYLGFQHDNIIALAAAGSGLASLFLSDVIENMLSGMNILTDRLFNEGDVIAVGEYEGVVDRITLSKTYLITADNERISIENSTIAKSVIINRTNNKVLRTHIKVPIKKINYSRAKLKALLFSIMDEQEKIMPDLDPSIELLEATGQAEIWKIEFNIRDVHDTDEVKSALLLSILDKIDAEL